MAYGHLWLWSSGAGGCFIFHDGFLVCFISTILWLAAGLHNTRQLVFFTNTQQYIFTNN